jgi:hypothetical protein
MGQTRVSIRTLPSGEKVYHYPPTEEFPEGRTVLINDESALASHLESRKESNEEALGDLRVITQAKVEAKKVLEAADPAVPPEKRFI